MKTAIIKSSELGTNCWLACRFVEGSRCDRIMFCTYPEKATCKAVDAEIEFLRKARRKIFYSYTARIRKLMAGRCRI